MTDRPERVIRWSHSSLKDYEGCARRYYEVKVLNKYPFQETDATRYGVEVHKALEMYIRDGTPIPPEYLQFKDVVDALIKKPGRKLAEYEMALTKRLQPCDWKSADVWVRGIADILIVDDASLTAWVGDWKGLALDTKIPTPTGWTTMRDVAVGDTLFSESGEQCTVVGKSAVKNLRCFKITFDDTTTVVCDEEHLWKLADGSVVPVTQLRGKKRNKNDVSPSRIAVAAPLALPDVALPIDPYVLGLWLADGKHTSGEISKPDTFIWDAIKARGYDVDMGTGGNKSCPTRTAKGLSSQLRAAGLLGNKHIPQWALRAGYEQRLALLRGLMDGDGNANPTRKQAIFTTTDKYLSDGVMELLCSLGQRPLQSVTTQRGFGLTVTAYPISFRPVGINPFLLPRKASRIDPDWGSGDSATRRVVSVEEVASIPTQCIAVDSSDHTFLCTERMVPTHNTGNDKYPDQDQLVLMALMVFAHFPHIQKVNGALLFIVKGSMVKMQMLREQADAAWWKYRERTARLENSFANNVWNPTQTALCRWCPVVGCPFNPKH